MSVLHRTRSAPADRATPPPPGLGDRSPTSSGGRVERTRTSAAWIGSCTAAAVLVVLIVFMLQNTRGVEVTFLWMHGTVPLALALLIAGVGVAIVAMVIGTARISQLRRRVSRQGH
jgi:lipopolysaccharide assembly protein A